jgi:hypothetical protein
MPTFSLAVAFAAASWATIDLADRTTARGSTGTGVKVPLRSSAFTTCGTPLASLTRSAAMNVTDVVRM